MTHEQLFWDSKTAIWFPEPGKSINLFLYDDENRKYLFSITRSRIPPSPHICFNLCGPTKEPIARLETSGSHQNPSRGNVPDELLSPFRGYRFNNEPHLHLW